MSGAAQAVPGAEGAGDAVAVVVVTHESGGQLEALAAGLLPELRPEDELVVVDNASSDGTATTARRLLAGAQVVETGANLGFAGGCDVGADATRAPLLLFLNPDCRPQPGCLARLRESAAQHPRWAAWQALVLLEDGRVNSSGGVVHYLGMGWAGDCERPLASLEEHDREIAFPSGAAMVVRRGAWQAIGGLDHDYFMYGEDLDLGLRLWLAGWRVGAVHGAHVTHGYEFQKGSYKWFWLERNRWRTVLSVYPAPLLALLFPALLAAELGLIVIAARERWLGAKLRSQAAVIAGLPAALARRRAVQQTRRIGSREFAGHLTSALDSPYLGVEGNSALAAAQGAYWHTVLWLLRAR